MKNEYFFSLAERLNSVQEKLYSNRVDLSTKRSTLKVGLHADTQNEVEDRIEYIKKQMLYKMMSELTEEQLLFNHSLKFEYQIEPENDNYYFMRITLNVLFSQVNNQ